MDDSPILNVEVCELLTQAAIKRSSHISKFRLELLRECDLPLVSLKLRSTGKGFLEGRLSLSSLVASVVDIPDGCEDR